jgi:hypothetical protein
MHEGSFDSAEEDDRPIYAINNRKDGGLREDWKEAAEYIAHIEGGIALSRRNKQRYGSTHGDDELEPGFVMVGRREGLSAIAEATTGIIEHGQAFVAWADLVGDDPEALRHFDEAFLGSWDGAAEFAERVMAEVGLQPSDASEEDQQFHMLLLASELAEELQQRGVICAIPNNRDGVWVFRPPEKRAPQDRTGVRKGGEHA